jgi:hypothetical protein
MRIDYQASPPAASAAALAAVLVMPVTGVAAERFEPDKYRWDLSDPKGRR